jgi:purine nucleosidase
MLQLHRFAIALLLIGFAMSGGVAAEPVPLVFDTDMGNDIDDALALATIHALQSRNECKLLAVTSTKDNPYSAPYIDLVNTFYGRGDIPVGAVRNGPTPKDSKYIQEPCLATDGGKPRYPYDLKSGGDAPEAVVLLRKVLASQADGSVVMVQVGFSTNLARLLDSKPDAVSPLDGKALVKKKVRLLSTMAGGFSPELVAKKYAEYNVKIDLPAATKLFAEWPTPIVASGYEIGMAIKYTAFSIENDYNYVAHHPLREAYHLYMPMPYDRPTWDLTSVLYAVRPERGYFELSPPGTIVVEGKGETSFKPSPNGQHRFLIASPEQAARVLRDLELLASQPPQKR